MSVGLGGYRDQREILTTPKVIVAEMELVAGENKTLKDAWWVGVHCQVNQWMKTPCLLALPQYNISAVPPFAFTRVGGDIMVHNIPQTAEPKTFISLAMVRGLTQNLAGIW